MMSKNSKERTYYEIKGTQALPLIQLKFSLHKESTQIIFYMILNQKLEFDLLKRAVNEEIARNDSLRIRFEKHNGKSMQYFMPEYQLVNIPVFDFTGKSKQEQDAALSKDARTPLKTKNGELYRVILYRTHDGNTGIYLNISHVIADLYAMVLFFTDLLEVIIALKDGTPMPKLLASFEECLKKDLVIFGNQEEEEKHSGCRVNALPLRTVITKDKTFMQAIEHTQQVQYQILRHTDYLFELAKDGLKAWEKRSLFQASTPCFCLVFRYRFPVRRAGSVRLAPTATAAFR